MSVLFVDVGDEEEAGPLRRFQNSRERCKFLAPSISVSVPEDDPYHSDEEYYEHPLFSPEWTHSGARPTGHAVAFRQIEGEPRMVPLCHSPLISSHFYFPFVIPSFLSSLPPFDPSVSPSVCSSFRIFVCLCVRFLCLCDVFSQDLTYLLNSHTYFFIHLPKAIASCGCHAVNSMHSCDVLKLDSCLL